jgi:GNAT superfamily N-acetyltransferase
VRAAAPVDVGSSPDPAEALGAAEGFLLGQPVHNNVVVGLLHDRVSTRAPGRYWWARRGDEVAGFAFQSPLHFRAAVSPSAPAVVEALVDAMAADAPDLPGVSAEAATAAAFAGRWAERTGRPAVPVEGQRIYRLGRLRPPSGVPGSLRRAGPQDRGLLVGWVAGFLDETGAHPLGPEELTDRHLARGLWLWDVGKPVSMAVASSPLAGVSRIGFVYTPPPHRGRGYAAACVAALSGQVVAGGAACMLYTQLQNPTSNAVYRRIGYEPVSEVLVYRFG